MRLTIFVAVFLAAGSALAQKWTPEATLQLKAVSEVRVSPDGTHVTYTVTQAVMADDKSENVRQIWMAKTDGSESAQVTFGEKSSSDAQWLPDSSGFVFTSARSGKPQLYLLRLRGGEAEPLTAGKMEAAAFAISTDGRLLAFTASDIKEDAEKKEKAKEDYRWIDEDQKPRRLYVLPLSADANGKREPKKLVSGDFNVGSEGVRLSWSPDSKWIAYPRTKSTSANDWPSSDISMVNIDSGEIRAVASTRAAEDDPYFSPDGKWIAYAISDDPPTWGGIRKVQLFNIASGERKDVATTFDAQPNIVGFSSDGKRIFVVETRGTVDRVYAIDVAANKVLDVSTSAGALADVNVNRTSTYFSFGAQSLDKPAEAFVTRADRFEPVQVSHVNEMASRYRTPKSEVVHWRSTDGTEIEGVLTYPIDYTPGKRVPLALIVHGGPAGVFRQSFVGNPSPFPAAVFASDGYAVLRANPRGSSGYGRKFRYANYKDWGGGDFNDLMTGVDDVIKSGLADPDRLGVMGWSYGGFMTSWIIGHTDRFKAAVVGAGVTDLLSFTGTADIPGFLPDYFGGNFWETTEAWRAHSPIMSVDKVKTPTLIEHGEADERVPISQGYELYNALKTRGIPVRMVVFPRQHHGLTEPKMRLQSSKASVEWIEKWIPR
ncbi:MAG TPA: S9 family peptidase [Thermoanaerobaculia bacterium]|nr:S9 family peptidase [Thermoanaerobaculia bacterium]